MVASLITSSGVISPLGSVLPCAFLLALVSEVFLILAFFFARNSLNCFIISSHSSSVLPTFLASCFSASARDKVVFFLPLVLACALGLAFAVALGLALGLGLASGLGFGLGLGLRLV